MSISRQDTRGSRPWARQVPKGVDHWSGPDTVHNPLQPRLGLPGHLVNGSDDGRLLLGNHRQQGFPGGGRQAKARVHAVGLT